jgi:membrane-anchored protein YejM (alkaline phosphatase superfamily)
LFDLSQEPRDMADRYGRSRFGQSCLLARRLVESGVPFVQVNWADHVEAEEDAGDGGWDNHYRNFQIMQDRQAPWLDQTLSTLLDDLHQRGLLNTTMVIAVGEFGRTPRINDKAGRDHWEHCYSALIAGGGIRAGRVVGESDARAERVRERPLTPADIGATVMQAVGITSEQAATLGIRVEGRVINELI